ncbi:hypothetical protein L596_030103 [Steinernema carpocapsae]|uniref:SH3 domain-containing protein n=1 Tax=Steinernema carpocapsae TaxID=34508 RepID=A0A4U5LRR0_STECR|nr:hypothetical protein L596_030103 [Steinernema carpocapsae]
MLIPNGVITLIFVYLPLVHSNPQLKTKLCLNEYCSELLFSSKITRPYNSNHEAILSYGEGDQVDIFSFRYSDRADFLALS